LGLRRDVRAHPGAFTIDKFEHAVKLSPIRVWVQRDVAFKKASIGLWTCFAKSESGGNNVLSASAQFVDNVGPGA